MFQRTRSTCNALANLATDVSTEGKGLRTGAVWTAILCATPLVALGAGTAVGAAATCDAVGGIFGFFKRRAARLAEAVARAKRDAERRLAAERARREVIRNPPPTRAQRAARAQAEFDQKAAIILATRLPDEDKAAHINAYLDELDEKLRQINA